MIIPILNVNRLRFVEPMHLTARLSLALEMQGVQENHYENFIKHTAFSLGQNSE